MKLSYELKAEVKKQGFKRKGLATAVCCLAGINVACILPAMAQEKSWAGIEEIVVTAEKREQNLQDVPVAISAFTSDMLDARGITGVEDLQYSVPSFQMGEEFGSNKITLRGVGAENIYSGGDPGVPVHVDGHYVQSPTYVTQDLFDVERVEVQRGPQGTLYGRNAIGGNINGSSPNRVDP